MKVMQLRIFIGFLFLLFSIGTNAQRSSGLTVEGTITVEEGSQDNVIIQMWEDGKRKQDYGVGSSGRYKVELQYNHKFEMIFQCEGNFSQKIVVETAVPREVLSTDPRFPAFPVNINLFKEIPGIDDSFSENTVLKIFYSPSVDNFVSELYYNDAQIQKLIEQAILQAQMVDKRADYMAQLTRAELAELRKEYNELLEQAGNEYANEQFLDALDGYKAASKIFPDEQFPKDRIAEINDLLGLIMAAEELDKAMLERFNKLVAAGDLQFSQTNYSEAKKSYDRALSIKPYDEYVNGQLDKIAQLQKQKMQEQEYQNLIANGDKAIKEMLYNEALGQFQKALEIKPQAQYPKTKINEINGLLADQRADQEKQKNYDDAMREGERQFTRQFYDRALTAFENALTYRPGDPEATRRIDDTKKVMQDILNQMTFDRLIAEADKAYKKEDYTAALTSYEQAHELFPEDPRTNKRVEEIRQILYAQQSLTSYISQADKQFDNKQYADAKSLYQRALELDSKNKHVQDRIAEIDEILVGMELEDQYKAIIAEADQFFTFKNYENSRTKYNQALDLKPREDYPQNKIKEIDDLLATIAKTNADYEAAVDRAERLFQQQNYTDARTAFTDAGKIKPEETYPSEMIAQIDGLIVEQERLAREAAEAEAARLAAIQAEKDKNYADAIARADNLFNQENYENSRNEYRAALDIKPEEEYPQQRIDEIGNILAQLSAAQAAYEEAVARGDREFRREGWDEAIVAYNEAKQAKADEIYPDEQLAKIDSIVTTRERLAREAAEAEAARLAAIQAEKDKNYADAIARADNLFNQENYENSRNEYRAALDIKPEEEYPQQRIDEIDQRLRELAAARAAQEDLDRRYTALITNADRYFGASNLGSAKENYQEASSLKPSEQYPKDKIAEIDSILEQRAIDEKYRNIIVVADGAFRTQKYDDARLQYELALGVKPDEEYPRTQIQRIDDIRAEAEARKQAEATAEQNLAQRRANIAAMQEELDEQRILEESGINALYDQLIIKADAFFDDTQYNVSRAWYFKALDLKPEEAYPQQRIDEINRILNGLMMSQRDREYQRFIDLADNSFRENELAVARGWYNQALGQKPDEQYPKAQLAEIEKRVQERLQGQSAQRVEQYKATARKAFDSGDVNVARFWYKKALELNPDDEEAKAGLSQTR